MTNLALNELGHEKTVFGFLTRFDTNPAFQPQRMARGLKCLCYGICQNQVFT